MTFYHGLSVSLSKRTMKVETASPFISLCVRDFWNTRHGKDSLLSQINVMFGKEKKKNG